MSLGASAPNSVALYAVPSYASIYTEPEDLEPGPGTYDLPGSIGHQHLSTCHSQPSSSLTAKHDKSWAKIMITKDHLVALQARGTPGPGTYIPALVESQSRVRFGTSKRRPMSDTSFKAPGPVYDITGNPDNPPQHIKFSKANRFERDGESLSKALGSTGPGQYELDSVFDGTHGLQKSFGASHRAYDRVRFPGCERQEFGRASPGPGAAQAFQNSGKGCGFGREERLKSIENKRAPGPGAYDSHERAYPHSRNQSVYSFGRPQAKGRIDWKQMRYLNNSVWGMR
jgi:hypothetical protein